MNTPQRRVAIIADDFGMCGAVNRGILAAVRARVVTQVSVMAVTPHAGEALAAIQRERIPAAVHLVAASDWDLVRWRPLTSAPTLVDARGYFPAHPAELAPRADLAELEGEWIAQIALVRASGCAPLHVDIHIALCHPGVLARVCRQADLPTREQLPVASDVTLAIDSCFHLSPLVPEEKERALLLHLHGLPPGDHVIVVHPAADEPELRSLCSSQWPGRRRWATSVRTSDLQCLLAPAVRRALESPAIALTTTSSFARRTDAAHESFSSVP